MEEVGAGGSPRTFLDKEQLFAALAVKTEDFVLPDGGTIQLRGLPLQEGLSALKAEDSTEDRLMKLVLVGVSEPKLEIGDLELLADSSVGLLQQIADAIMRLSGMGTGVGEDGELLQQADDFLPETPSGTSSSPTAQESSIDSPPS